VTGKKPEKMILTDEALQPTSGDEASPEEVQPNALPRLAELEERIHDSPSSRGFAVIVRPWSSPLARSATFSGVKPSSCKTTSPGAEAPNRSSDTTSSAHAHHPRPRPASTARRRFPTGKHSLSVGIRLGTKELPRGHGHHARFDPVSLQEFARGQRQVHLRPGRDEDQIVALFAHVSAAAHSALRRRREHGELLACEHERRGTISLERQSPGLSGLVGVCGP
jgi:hypothetical protein